MDLTRHWLAAQRSTPSFVSTFNDISDILDAPLPAALRAHSPRSMNRSQTPGRSVTPTAALAAAYTPGRKIHEELIEKGKLYEQRKEALREKYIREELKAMTPRSKTGAAAASSTPAPANPEERRRQREEAEKERKKKFEKLYKEAKRREDEEYFRKLKVEKEEKEKLEGYGFKPKISSKARRTTSRVSLVDQQSTWQRRKEEELERLRRERIVEEMAEVQEGPDITLRSQKIAMKLREKEGLAGLSHIEAMLERDRLKKLARWEEQQKAKMQESANPKITMFAAELPRPGEVGDRLYAESFEIEERKAQRIREKLGSKQESFTPRITSYASSVRRDRPVEDDLMMRHLEALAERDELLRQQEERRVEQHMPAINPVSDAIASRLPLSARERLYQQKPRSEDRENESQQRNSFARTNSTTSTASTLTAERERERAEKMRRDEERRREKIEQLQQEKLRKELEECTFTPKTSRRTPSQGPDGNVAPGAGGTPKLLNPAETYNRMEQWQKRREMKLAEQLAQKKEAERNGCTFAPNVDLHRDPHQSLNVTAGNTIYGGDGKPWGMDEFIQRQQLARKEREERAAKQTTDTSHWRPGSTIPVEFRFHQPANVRALDRPVGPGPREPSPDQVRSEQPPVGHQGPTASSSARFGVIPGGTGGGPSGSSNAPIVPFSVLEHQQTSGGLSPEAARQTLGLGQRYY
jgi:hypothetical protein